MRHATFLDADDANDTDLFSPSSFIICHAELVSASDYWSRQILKLVQDDGDRMIL